MNEELLSGSGKIRIIQELVPGKQITIAHLIANPDAQLYEKLGLNPNMDYSKSAIGIITISPAETAVIAADIAVKSAGVELGFVDRFSGTLIVTGTISETESSLKAILDYVEEKMGFTVCGITRT
ncbi:propanediol utilization protein PduU [Lachnospiraceae bacterium]|jgi:ethanolamine utilization protein EutS|nr:BMC domain-containing protein [Dorea sp.]GFI38239.1 propanediol utilization protein PduU [Lachnospiraceae bacterium]